MKQNRPIVIGLTGTIGSGKSESSKILKEIFKIPIIDADKIAYKVVEKGSKGLKIIEKEFGSEFVLENGEYNRALMAKTVFDNKEALDKLNSILHPLIKEEKERQLEELKNEELIVYDCPLLFETGEDKTVDTVLLITTDENIRLERVKNRDKLTEDEIKRRIQSQKDEDYKLNNSDIVLYNNGTLEDLKNSLSLALKEIIDS